MLARIGLIVTVSARSVRDLLGDASQLPPLPNLRPAHTVTEAVARLRELGLPQLPVVRAEPPVLAAEVAGSVGDVELLQGLATGRVKPDDRLADHLAGLLPSVGAGEPVAAALTALEAAPVLLVLQDGKPVAVLTRDAVLADLVHG